MAFTGDAAGIRLPLSPWIDLPAPPPEFDPVPDNNTIVENTILNNGNNPDPTHPFAFAAADIITFIAGDFGNCFIDNVSETYFGLIPLPECDPADEDAEGEQAVAPGPALLTVP